MRKRTKVVASNKRFTLGEYIRVVPLHFPESAVLASAPPTAKLTYRDGPLLTNVEVFTIFWGNMWGSTSESGDLMEKLNIFFSDILVSPMIDQLMEYSVVEQAISHGSLIGNKVISADAPVSSITDSSIQTQ